MNPPTQTGAPPSAKRPKKGNGVTTPSRRGGSGRVLTDVIVDLGFVERGEMDEAIERANGNGSIPERILVADGILTEGDLARAVAERFGLDHLDLGMYKVDPDAAKLVTPAAVKRYQAVPVSFAGDRMLLVAMVDPANVLAVDDIAVMTGYEVRPAVASGSRHRPAARAPRGPRLRHRRHRAGDGARGRRDRGDPAVRAARSRPGRCTTSATTRRSTSAPAARMPRSSSSCTASSRRRWSGGAPTSTSSRATRRCASATASTACSRRPPRCPTPPCPPSSRA